MITVFGHLQEDTASSPCVSVVFNGGPNGGSVTYNLCGGTKISTLTLGPGQDSFQLCVTNNSWTLSDFFMSATTSGSCSGLIVDPGDDPVDPYNAFTVENTETGYTIDVKYNGGYVAGDIVSIAIHTGCYEILGPTNVSDPTSLPHITGTCGGDGEPSETTNAFTVENTETGYTIDVQYDSIYTSGDIVSVSIHTGCYEILGTTIVSDPTSIPTISGMCGGDGDPSEPDDGSGGPGGPSDYTGQ